MLRAGQAWPGVDGEGLRQRARRRAAWLAAAATLALVAWPVLLWLTAAGASSASAFGTPGL